MRNKEIKDYINVSVSVGCYSFNLCEFLDGADDFYNRFTTFERCSDMIKKLVKRR